MQHFIKKLLTKKTALILLSLTAVLLVIPESAHAGFWLDAFTGTGDFVGRILTTTIEVFLLPLAAWFMYIAGSIMDAAVNFGLNTAYIFSLSPAVNLGWVIVRDIANIFFIFILIYISLGTIIQGTKFGTKQLLTQVIIAALLINFSLFITKAVIDVSNIFGNWLYGGVQKTLHVNTAVDPTSPVPKNISLSGLISNRLGLTSAWTSLNAVNPLSSDPAQSLIGRVLRLTIALITTYIFLYCAVLFIARSVTLLFLLVFSPIGFMGGVLPQLKKYSGQWRDELLGAAIFPIAFLLMLYISLQFINSIGKLGLTGSMGDIQIAGSSFSVGQYFQYFLVIFLLNATLKVAKDNSGELGKMLGGAADTLGKMAVNAGIGLGIGGVAIAGRTIAAGAFAEKGKTASTMWDTFRANSPLATALTTGPGLKQKAKDVLKKGTYDTRNLKSGILVGPTLGELAKTTTGYDIGKTGNVLGFDTEQKTAKERGDEKKKWDEEIKVDKAQKAILEDMRDLMELQDSLKKAELEKDTAKIKDFEAKIITQKTKMSTEKDDKGKTADTRIKEKLTDLSNKQLEKLGIKYTANEHVVGLMTGAEVQHLKDKSELSDADKGKVWAARIKPLVGAIEGKLPPGISREDAIRDNLIRLSDAEVGDLKPEILKDDAVIPLLTPGQLGKIAQNLSRADRKDIREKIGRIGNTKAQKWIESESGQGAQF